MHPDQTPVIVAIGQCVARLPAHAATLPSPTDLLAQAARRALADSGAANALAAAIDTVAVIRYFEHSTRGEAMVAHPFGCADNVPGALARRLGLAPQRLVYADVGGQTPQRLLNRYCAEIAAGTTRGALIAGAEAIASIKHALRSGLTPDWREAVGGDYTDEWTSDKLANAYERAHGLYLPLRVYPLFENAARVQAGRTLAAHRNYMGQVLAPLSEVAAANPFAQFPVARSAADMAGVSAENFLISEPYTKWMVAQDAVNQGAAVVVTSLGLARELGIPPSRYAYLRSSADLDDLNVTARPDLARSEAQVGALRHALAAAGVDIQAIAHLDLYSCFPIAVTTACAALGLAPIGGPALTLTGGLPFFGGPGNNYSLHAIAEAVARVRGGRHSLALVAANGGYLSKHSVGIYAGEQLAPWQPVDNHALARDFAALPTVGLAAPSTSAAVVESYVLTLRKGAPELGYVAARAAGQRLLARPEDGDTATLAALGTHEPIGRPIQVRHDGAVHRFRFTA
ncbi:MAG: acetyl-CoA acetyltransferase [Gammaproteobacteria bacterium]|nr:acetyl-CoA acetyltransferase [Gammaproteobacteria bacterium]